MPMPLEAGNTSSKGLEDGYFFVHDFWLVYDYMLACLYSEGKKLWCEHRQERPTKPQHLIYITLTIEFEQQYFLNVLYSGVAM